MRDKNTAKFEDVPTMASARRNHKALGEPINSFRELLLNWYDENRRHLPWRAPAGISPDPYKIWLSEIMLQQTVVAAVIPYFLKFVKNWPTVQELAAAEQEEIMNAWAGLGYYSRARNLHKCAKIITEKHGGVFPADQETLKTLPGIGEYTSAAITAIAFNMPATVVDGNVERVTARYFAVKEPLPAAKKILHSHARLLAEGKEHRPGDFAQAMMDLGATICIPKAPRCAFCPLRGGCAGREAGIAAELPARLPKKAKPKRWGQIYWIENSQGQVLLERRGEKGLLGGMPGFPTSAWGEIREDNLTLAGLSPALDLQLIEGLRIFHSFTHFDLELEGYNARMDSDVRLPHAYFWVDRHDVEKIAFPTVFKKFVRLVLQDNK